MSILDLRRPTRTKWRGKTMCFKPERLVFVGDKVLLRVLPSGEAVIEPFKARLFYSYLSAWDRGVDRHALVVVNELAEQQGFTIDEAIPQTLFDGWEFRIECARKPRLPPYITFRAGQRGDE